MFWNKIIFRSLLGVGIFCCVLGLNGSSMTAIAEDMSEKDFLAFFADEKGYEFGGVIARTMGEEQVVWLGAPEAGVAHLKLYTISEAQFLDALVYPEKRDVNNYSSVKLRPFPLKKESLKETADFSVEVAASNERTRISLPIKTAGVYYLEGTLGGRRGEMLLVASNIAAQTKEEGKNLVLWTVDSRTGKHVTSGDVAEYQFYKKKKELGRSSIDSQGLTRIPRSEEGDIALIRSQGELAFVPLNYASHVPQPTSSYGWWGGRFVPYAPLAKSYSFTDRMLYQPGDMVYFKSIVRQDDDARYVLPQGLAKIKVWTGWGESEKVIFEKTQNISETGAVDGSFVIPKDAKTGDYFYSISYGNLSKGERYFYSTADATFSVDHYRKPEFGLDISASHDRLIVGDTLELDFSGSYFSGEPLVGKTVEYNVTTGTYYDYEYLPERDVVDDDYRYGGWYGPSVAKGEITLDAAGKYHFTLPTKSHQNFSPQVYHVEITGKDSEENPVYESRNVLVLPGDFSMYQRGYSYGTRVGEMSERTLQLVANREGTSLTGRELTVKVHHRRWVNDSPSEKYGYYRLVERDLADMAVTTDGSGKATLSFVPDEEGSYTLTFLGNDERGNTIKREVYLWASDQDGWFYQADENGGTLITLKTDKESYRPSEKAKILIASPLTNRDVWLSFERAGVHRSEVVALRGNTVSLDLPLEESDMPNIFVSGTMFSPTALVTEMTEIAVSAESKRIAVELHSDKKQYEPGETVSLEVIGKDSAGKPVSGEVAVWAIDKALFELLNQAPADIFKTFWNKRFHSTVSAHSLEGVLFTLNMAEMGGCFVGDTPVLTPSGMKSISTVQVGDSVLTRESEEKSSLVEARVSAVHSLTVDGYLVINGDIRVTPEHRLFVNGSWRAAGDIQIDDTLRNHDGRDVLVKDISFVREKTTVYNLTVEGYHTYFAAGVWVHNDKDGTRSAFKDTAYWNPRVHLGVNGRARVTFRLPDNATTWVISGIATAGATQFGQARQEISVSKNVLVSEALPTLMRVGDRVEIAATVRNNTEEPLNFLVQGTFSDGVISDGSERSVSVSPMDSEEVVFSFLPETVNERATFQVRATVSGRDETFADAIVRTLPIRTTGFMQKSSQALDGNADYPILLPDDADRSRTKVTVDFSPSLLGTIPTAMRGLIDYPYGCVEQTTSRFVPLVIANREKGIFAKALEGKETTKMLEAGILHLKELQNDQGAWGFWNGGDSNPYITSYVIEYLIEARSLRVLEDEIDSMLARARTYVESASDQAVKGRQKTAALPYSVNVSENDFIPLVSLAYAKSLLGMPVSKYETQEGVLIPSFTQLTPELLALSVMTNVRNGVRDNSKNGVDALIGKLVIDDSGLKYWERGNINYYASRDAATALAIRALVMAQYDEKTLVPMVRSLAASRKAGYWSNTFATAQVIRALIDFSKRNIAENPNYEYSLRLDGELLESGKMTSILENKSYVIPGSSIKKEGSLIQVSSVGEGDLYSSVFQNVARVTDTFPGESHGLMMQRTYENVTDSGADPALGDVVRVHLTVSGIENDHNRLVVEDILPAGMVPVNRNFKNEQGNLSESQYWYGGYVDEYTENGAVISFYTYSERSRQYEASYLARVVNTGDYFVPPAYAELMYAPEIYAYTEASRIHIPAQSDAPEKKTEPFFQSSDEGAYEQEKMWLLIRLILGLALFSGASAVFLMRRS